MILASTALIFGYASASVSALIKTKINGTRMIWRNKLHSLFFVLISTVLVACKTTYINNPVIEDINPDPKIVEINLTAKVTTVEYQPGVSSIVWSYNGIVPGPTIEANVGDTLIVNFKNELPDATTVHWHGLELPANMDGSMIAQNPVQPNGTFRYEFKLLRASTFWYHPHIRGNEQVELGLQGMLIVHDVNEDNNLQLPASEHQWVLDDVLLDDAGKLVDVGFPSDPVQRATVQINGREGNTLLVNGKVNPSVDWVIGEPQRVRVVNTSNTRFMRISIPGHTIYRIGGDAGLLETPIELAPINQVPVEHDDMMTAASMDGGMEMGACMDMGGMGDTMTSAMDMGDDMPMPMMSNPDRSLGLLLTPGERADFVVIPAGNKGDLIAVEWHDTERGRHSACLKDGMVMLDHQMGDGQAPVKTLLEINLVKSLDKSIVNPSYKPAVALRSIIPIDVNGAPVLPVMFGHTEPTMAGDIDFFVSMMNGSGVTFENITAAMAPSVNVGDTRVIEVTNMTMGDHNFHIHGFMFQLIETEYVDMDNPANNRIVSASYLEEKDTIILPRRTGMVKGRSKTITRLAIRFSDEGREGQITASGKVPTDTESGGWLFHCHLLDHGDRGMASFLQVFD